MSIRVRQNGFTLVELLVALVIFSILTTLSYRALNSLIQTRERMQAESNRWREVMIFFNRFDQDIRQRINRSVRDTDNRPQAAWLAKPVIAGPDDAQLIFSRLGSPDQNGTLMDTQRLGYRLRDNNIEQLIWPSLDAGETSRPAAYPVLSHVRRLSLKYMVRKDHLWVDRWPVDETTDNALPAAVVMQVTLETGEVLNRTYTLP